ncbi:uncharacterized protein LOC126681873 [Mercurialis annua]|uniref:uncharacterized protein LOC126681873 n=1 Tax=Mercurialis annua TaxID=3986 RepID=UPI00215E5941|nr:uncharacterized protein LOC126681873 [Mercurialis annua]
MGNLRTVHELKDLVSFLAPNFIFLMETKISRHKLYGIRSQLGFDGIFIVDSVGTGGGLAMLWKGKGAASLLSYSHNHIDLEVTISGLPSWRLTGFYACPERHLRKNSWNLLRRLSQTSHLPWCIIGDFNDLLAQSEKRGRLMHPESCIDNFRDVITDCALTDLVLNNLNAITSDHTPIFLKLFQVASYSRYRRFRFENAWLNESDCRQVVHDNWHGLTSGSFVLEKIACCGQALNKWGLDLRNQFKHRIGECKYQLRLLKGKHNHHDVAKYKSVSLELGKLYDQQNSFWKQRAKQHWLNAGDQNTKFFHNAATHRRRLNNISSLTDEFGVVKTWDNGLDQTILGHFAAIFSSQGCHMDMILNCIEPQISDEQNSALLCPVTNEEVKLALFSMHPDKSLGPDGLNPAFFQKFWDIVGSDVIKACDQFMLSGTLPISINDTLVILIPKRVSPSVLGDLRPISLCNVIYKVFSKVLANRLKGILNSIVGESQCAFIQGRLISDNILIAGKVSHYLNRKTQGKDGVAVLKVDMSKAYDRIEWHFLRAIMLKFGFHEKWVQLVMACVTTVSYTFLVNGRELGPLIPSRGLRQGDPLSPYLFIMCAEGLSAIFSKYVSQQLIHGCRIARTAPILSHLFFADDILIFFRATTAECLKVNECLHLYQLASGQTVNLSKSSIQFSKNTTAPIRSLITSTLGVSDATGSGSFYLGLPTCIGRSKRAAFSFIKDKVWSRLHSWNNNFLSKAGKEILIKTVLQALPIYTMKVFLLPLNLCAELERMLNSFWWGQGTSTHSGIHWQRWERLCAQKVNGGMGFRKLHEFNLSLLGKQGWRILNNPSSLLARILKGRYFPKSSFVQATVGNNPSYGWRSIIAAKSLLSPGYRKIIGDGKTTAVWGDPWLLDVNNPYASTPFIPELEGTTVSSLLKVDSKDWDVDVITDVLCIRDAQEILKIPLTSSCNDDKWSWRFDRKGLYTVRSAYKALMEVNNNTTPNVIWSGWKHLWKLKVPPKVKNFLWRCCSNCLPTRCCLRQRGMSINTDCPLCLSSEETITHLLLSCTFAKYCWALTDLMVPVHPCHDLKIWLDHVFCTATSYVQQRTVMLLWAIWNNRNVYVWTGRCVAPNIIVHRSIATLLLWQAAQGKSPSFGELTATSIFWQPPQPGFLKCNFDGAVFAQACRLGTGCVVRDSSGRIVGVHNRSFAMHSDPFLAEVISLKEALSWLGTRQVQHVQFESDSQLLVTALSTNAIDNSYIGFLLQDCRIMLSHFTNSSVSFIRRSANMIAHLLARDSYSMSDVNFWDPNIRCRCCVLFIEAQQAYISGRSSVDQNVCAEGYMLNDGDRAMLESPVTAEEIKNALFSIGSDKAPGPDGFSSMFFKKCWSTIGSEITEAISDFFSSNKMLKQTNSTAITLIPKIKDPTSISEYRPISCCNVIYKGISKVITNRIRGVIDKLVSPCQSAFIPGRSIAENILLAHEIVRNYHRSKGNSCGLGFC